MMLWCVFVAMVMTVGVSSFPSDPISESNFHGELRRLSMLYPGDGSVPNAPRNGSTPRPLLRPIRSVSGNYPSPSDQPCDPENPPNDDFDLTGSSDEAPFTAGWLRKRPISSSGVLDTAIPERSFHNKREALDLVSCLNHYKPKCGTCAVYHTLKYTTLIHDIQKILQQNLPEVGKLLEIPPSDKIRQFVVNTRVRKIELGRKKKLYEDTDSTKRGGLHSRVNNSMGAY
ncbi:uncharacterized protein LOC143038560 [Oratosquilla oratoria]|uniref:uncharacterized protein LOC143038560 n=1 Tax=Oratosquilla oratoria TaxID=337810 RepID=UPI003F76F5DA